MPMHQRVLKRAKRSFPFKHLLITVCLLVMFHVFCAESFASTQVTLPVEVTGGEVEAGDIIVIYEDKFIKSFASTDLTLYGVVTDDPIISMTDSAMESPVLVSTLGETIVKVTALNGPINAGDFIGISSVPGVGQKATASGQVLGVALEDYRPEDSDDISRISILINITSAYIIDPENKDLIGILKTGVQAPMLTPLTSLRYIIAALIVLISFYIGFTSFGKISVNSVEAVGRNPLASKSITATVIFNFIFTVAIIGVGLLIAYLILIL